MRVCPGCRATYPDGASRCANDDLPLIAWVEGVEPAVGSQLGGYELGGVLFEGTLGTIHVGIHPLFRKRVAVKVLKRRVVHDTRTLTAFIKAIYAVNEIGHPGVVDVYSVGALDDGRVFVVMDLVEGVSLRQIQQQRRRLQPGVALPIFEQLCRIVGAVHQAGLLHLGLEPGRVLVLRCPPYPTIRVLGFGSCHLGGAAPVDIREPTIMSAPFYTAPEQQPGERVDTRADVYSIGALLYEVLVGKPPSLFPEADHAEGLATVGETLRAVALRALAADPVGRFGSTAELLAALREALGEPLPWNVDLDGEPGGETHVTGPPVAPPSDGSLTPEAIEGEIPPDEISARAALTFRSVEDDGETTAPMEVPTAEVPTTPEINPLAPSSVLGEPDLAEIDDIDQRGEAAGVHVLTEVTPPRGDAADVDEGLELDFSTDGVERAEPVGRKAPPLDGGLETDSDVGFIAAGGSDDLDVSTDAHDEIEGYLAGDVTPPVDEPPVPGEGELEEKTGRYAPSGEARKERTQNEVVVTGLTEHASDEAYQEPDATVPFNKPVDGREDAEPPPALSLSNLAAHAREEEEYVEPDLTRPYGPEVEEVLAQEKQSDSPRPRFPSVGPLEPEPLEPTAPPEDPHDDRDEEGEEAKKPDGVYLSIELVDEEG